MTFFLAVDPGLYGAFALYDPNQVEKTRVIDMPIKGSRVLPEGVAGVIISMEMRAALDPIKAVVERVGSMPRQKGAFNFGLSTGVIHGALAASGIPMELVTPSQWKPAMGLQKGPGETPEDTKDRARALAAQLFPHMAEQFARKKDDGRAEALLLAVYYSNRRTL